MTADLAPVPPGVLSIALVSEHASPLAALGGVDSGGQNVHVAALAAALAGRGHRVTVHTRRDAPDLPDRVRIGERVEVHHVTAGPPEPVPKDRLLPYMDAFARVLVREWRARTPDVVHSHYWMSGLASLGAAREVGLPLLHTHHALGTVKRRHQGAADTSPPERIGCEIEVGLGCDRVVATCRDEVAELVRMGVPADRIGVVPCGVDTARFTPAGPRWARGPYRHRLVQLGRLVPRKGAAVSVAALALLPGTELLVAGGPRRSDSTTTRRCAGCARWRGTRGSPTGCGSWAGWTPSACRRCCAPPTWCSVPPTTSPSASSRWRPWPAAVPWSPARSVASSTPSPTRPPDGSCRPAIPRRWPPPWRACSPTRPAARPAGRRAAAGCSPATGGLGSPPPRRRRTARSSTASRP